MIIPIGVQCTSATFKKEIEQTYTLPFDWMLSTPSFVFFMLELLLEQNIDIEDLVKNHFFYCDKRANMKGVEHYYTCEKGVALYNTKYNVIFPHDNYNVDNINKYIRRFERLKNIILHSDECLYFLYISQSSSNIGNFTINGNTAVRDVYIYLSKIHDLIAKFRNNFKIIIFDTILNEPTHLLDNNITLIKLNKQNSWLGLLPQIKKYTHIFNT